MGKMFTYLTILIFIDLMFLITGQLTGTLTSMIFEILLDVSVVRTSSFWIGLISGAAGIQSFITASLVTVGFILTKSDTVLYAAIAGSLGILVVDFVVIFNILKVYSPILATLVIAPIAIMYVLTIAEWARGRD